MEIVKVDKSNKDEYWNFISQDPVTYFFEMDDFNANFDTSIFWLAKQEEKIVGSMFYNKTKVLRIYGNNDIVEEFLKIVDFSPKYLDIPEIAHTVIPKYIAESEKRINMIRLIKQKVGIIDNPSHFCFKLSKNQIQEALNVFKAAVPEDWENSKIEDLPFDEKNIWYGIKQDNKLVSVCWNQILEAGSHIAFLATHPDYQHQGMASSILHFALRENFQYNDLSVIQIREDNEYALQCYTNAGYEAKMWYIVLKEPKFID
jgi:ribosomal protein S18 acetylase RimI-like enzyme